LLSLKELTAGYDKPMTESMVRLYIAVLLDLTKEEIVLVFSRSRDRVQVLSKPRIRREFSGRPATGDTSRLRPPSSFSTS
jgi:hypothetical protein